MSARKRPASPSGPWSPSANKKSRVRGPSSSPPETPSFVSASEMQSDTEADNSTSGTVPAGYTTSYPSGERPDLCAAGPSVPMFYAVPGRQHDGNKAGVIPATEEARAHPEEQDGTRVHEIGLSIPEGTQSSEVSAGDIAERKPVIHQTVFNITNNFTGPVTKIVINQA